MYGKELILDLHACKTHNRKSLHNFCIDLCEVLDMVACDIHFWESDDSETDPKTTGISVVQFIITSSLVIHTLPLLKSAYINIFSCKDFDAEVVTKFIEQYFDTAQCKTNVIERV